MSETASEHKEKAPKHLAFALIICSTSRYQVSKAGKQVADESGDLMAKMLQDKGYTITLRRVVPDDKLMIEETVREMLQSPNVDVVITCGGTGITPSDVTIETIEPIFEKLLPGFGEIFRSLSYEEIGSAAVMTRAIAGATKNKAIFCLPGSPQAVKLCLERLILPEVGHIIFHVRER